SGSIAAHCDGGSAAHPGVEPALPTVMELSPPYPNPGRDIVVQYALPAQQAGMTIDLGVFDLAGRRVATLASGTSTAGRFSAEWRAGPVRAGLYFVRFRVGSEVRNRVVTVLN